LPFTALNKTINVLILGVFAILLACALGQAYRPGLLAPAIGQLGTTGAAVILILGTPPAVLCGTVLDRLAERFLLAKILDFVDAPGPPNALFRWTRSVGGLLAFRDLREVAHQAISKTPWAGPLDFTKSYIFLSAIEAIGHHDGKREAKEWVLEHYAASRLSAGLALTLTIGELAALPLLTVSHHKRLIFWLLLAGVASLYGLITNAVDLYLYSYEALFREAFAVIIPLVPPPPTSPPPAPTAPTKSGKR
jgi:hypothetical protein